MKTTDTTTQNNNRIISFISPARNTAPKLSSVGDDTTSYRGNKQSQVIQVSQSPMPIA